ncbi:YdgH/BhsA/McbA-like domain containing protein [Morganella psychrotolerans]|uniref:YdgH/BhsA/McbA-like domain containing protein n=1 Tax=Morganella psychrotolerans TaxID=368603 RepID=UPI0039B0EE26
MKMSAIIPAVLALSAVSFGSMAATEVQDSTSVPAGVVSVSNVDTLANVTAALSKKADEAGASSFRIISAGGENLMTGTAEIYK